MASIALHRGPLPAPGWWHSLADILDFSRRQSQDFWTALASSQDPRLAALRFRCGQHEEYLKTQRLNLLVDGRMLTTFLSQVWTPHVMCLALEALFQEGRLSRQDCTVLQRKFLVRTDRDGRWSTPH